MKKILAFMLLMSAGFAIAEPVTITWDPVGLREDGSEIEGSIDYVVIQNGEQIAETASNVVTVEVENKLGSTFCVATRETNSGAVTKSANSWETNSGAVTKSANSCATIPGSLPQAPTIKIQLIYDL